MAKSAHAALQTIHAMSNTSICYEDNPVKGGNPVPYWKIQATRSWLKHYENMLMLEFFATHETDWALKRRAEHELSICKSKMSYMEKHGNFNQAEATKGAEVLKKKWNR